MNVSTAEWLITAVATVAVLLFDVFVVARRPHVPSVKECAVALGVYVGLAVVFGVWVWQFHGRQYGIEFAAGWLTEYSLSIDNLFVFILIMNALQVPRKLQQEALMVGIILALTFRAVFIAAGKVAIDNFSWVFYIFGAFLIYTAWTLLKGFLSRDEEEYHDNKLIVLAREHLNMSDEYHGLHLFIKDKGKALITPMFIVIVALGSTDVMFALDSIPAIYGLTNEAYIVFTANVFALMGLRQLYFLLGDMVRRLVYLPVGLAIILAFIGVKLVLHALHSNDLPFINAGSGVGVPQIETLLSLAVIVVTLILTAVASLLKSRGDGRAAA